MIKSIEQVIEERSMSFHDLQQGYGYQNALKIFAEMHRYDEAVLVKASEWTALEWTKLHQWVLSDGPFEPLSVPACHDYFVTPTGALYRPQSSLGPASAPLDPPAHKGLLLTWKMKRFQVLAREDRERFVKKKEYLERRANEGFDIFDSDQEQLEELAKSIRKTERSVRRLERLRRPHVPKECRPLTREERQEEDRERMAEENRRHKNYEKIRNIEV